MFLTISVIRGNEGGETGEIPEYLVDEDRERIAARGTETTFVVDESAEEFIVAYTGFPDALKWEYQKACEDRNEEDVCVFHLTKESWGIQLVRYETSKGMDGEVVWRRGVN